MTINSMLQIKINAETMNLSHVHNRVSIDFNPKEVVIEIDGENISLHKLVKIYQAQKHLFETAELLPVHRPDGSVTMELCTPVGDDDANV